MVSGSATLYACLEGVSPRMVTMKTSCSSKIRGETRKFEDPVNVLLQVSVMWDGVCLV